MRHRQITIVTNYLKSIRRRTKFQNLNDSRFVLQLILLNPLKPGVKSRMNIYLEQRQQGAVSIRKTVLQGMAIPMLKIRRPNGRLIFNMEIAIRR